jgi:hypothetical protein
MLNISKKRNAPLSTQEKREAPQSIHRYPNQKPKKTQLRNNPANTLKRDTKINPTQDPQETKNTPSNPTPLMNFRGKGDVLFRPASPRLRWDFTGDMEQSKFLSSLIPLAFRSLLSLATYIIFIMCGNLPF